VPLKCSPTVGYVKFTLKAAESDSLRGAEFLPSYVGYVEELHETQRQLVSYFSVI